MRQPVLSQAIEGASLGSADSPLGNLMKLAAEIANCPYSTLIAAHPGRDQVIAGWGVPSSFYRQLIANTPEDIALRQKYFQIEHAHLAPELETSRQVHEMGVRFMVGVPVPVAQSEISLSLVCGDFRENVVRAPDLRKRLEDIAQICAGLLRQTGEIVDQTVRLGQVRVQVDEFVEVIVKSQRFAAFLDSKFRVVRATPSFEREAGATFSREHRPRFSTLFPEEAANIETELELIEEQQLPFRTMSIGCANDNSTEATIVVVRISGSDIDQPKYVIDIRRKSKEKMLQSKSFSENLLNDIGQSSYVVENPSIAADFLFNTLVENRKVTHRKEVAYHSIRRWKSPIKDVQIEALKVLKQHHDANFIAKIAREILDEAVMLFGADAFEEIAAVPCGHSGPDCLACKLAEAIATLSQKRFRDAFEPLTVKGSSHPKTNARRPKMVLRDKPSKATLLVDDVATSGSHISEAIKLMRQAGVTVFPIAWIAG